MLVLFDARLLSPPPPLSALSFLSSCSIPVDTHSEASSLSGLSHNTTGIMGNKLLIEDREKIR